MTKITPKSASDSRYSDFSDKSPKKQPYQILPANFSERIERINKQITGNWIQKKDNNWIKSDPDYQVLMAEIKKLKEDINSYENFNIVEIHIIFNEVLNTQSLCANNYNKILSKKNVSTFPIEDQNVTILDAIDHISKDLMFVCAVLIKKFGDMQSPSQKDDKS